MVRKFIVTIVALIAIMGLMVSGCAPPENGEEPEPGPRTEGAWVDEIVISLEANEPAAVLKLQEGTSHIYGHGMSDSELLETVADDPDLDYALTIGSSRDFMFNVVGPEFPATGKLNPFHVAKIREAVQWVIDRDYMCDELLGGMGIPLYTQLMPGGAEEDRYSDIVLPVIEYYSYNPTKGAAIISEEMVKLGAVLVDEKWHYNGEPVVIHQLIRLDLKPYPEAGDYLADVLEGLGFTMDRLYRASADTWGPYLLKDPGLGLWHIYGGGWGMPAIFRTEVHSWAQFNTHLVMTGYPSWDALEPHMADWPEMFDAIVALQQTDFTTMAERADLVEIALTQVRQFANNIWTIAMTDFIPYRDEIDVVIDKCGGLSMLYAQTIHFKDAAGEPVRGGSIHIELPSILVQPINPVEGSAMSYDIMVSRDTTGDRGVAPHPQTGLNMPQRIERAEVTIQTGLPVGVSPGSDWCTLSFAQEIPVPLTAWADWDAENQVWITAAERMVYDDDYEPSAKRKSVVYYPDDLWEFPLHDGSILSMSDFMMARIVSFDRGKEDSPIFDSAVQAQVETDLKSFKGWEILSTDPLTIAVYSDVYGLDAEHSISSYFPAYGTYDEFAPWHTIAVGMLAEMDKQLTFSGSKADELGVEWMDFTKGPSLDILEARLVQATDGSFIPYEPTMADYVGPLEVGDRYSNLATWYGEKGHFWVSCGPFYLDEVFPIAKIVVLKAFDDYPDASDKWMWLLD